MARSQCRWECPEQWSEWSDWLAAGMYARNRWRLPVLLTGMLLASGRRTVTTWLRTAGVSDDYQDYYYFLTSVGCNSKKIASQLVTLVLRTLPLPERVLLVIDDSPTKALWTESRRSRCASQPDPGPRRSTHSCTAMSGSPSRWRCGIPRGGLWRCRCGRCCTFASRRCRRFPKSGCGMPSPPNCNWRPAWSNGSFHC